jgi:hypothetical protein
MRLLRLFSTFEGYVIGIYEGGLHYQTATLYSYIRKY